MSPDQLKDLDKHHNRINDQGESTIKGTIPWLLNEVMDNLDRVEDELNRKDRTSKRTLRIILKDLRDQLKELRRRFD